MNSVLKFLKIPAVVDETRKRKELKMQARPAVTGTFKERRQKKI
jgi:hypothetical protein